MDQGNPVSHAFYLRLFAAPNFRGTRPIHEKNAKIMRLLHSKHIYLFNKVKDIVKPFECCSAVTETHLVPEVDGVKHEVSHTCPELVRHREPLLGPHELPLAIAQSFQ